MEKNFTKDYIEISNEFRKSKASKAKSHKNDFNIKNIRNMTDSFT